MQKLDKLMSPLKILNISVLFFNISSEFAQPFVSLVNMFLNARYKTSNLSKAHETRDSLSSSYSQVVLI